MPTAGGWSDDSRHHQHAIAYIFIKQQQSVILLLHVHPADIYSIVAFHIYRSSICHIISDYVIQRHHHHHHHHHRRHQASSASSSSSPFISSPYISPSSSSSPSRHHVISITAILSYLYDTVVERGNTFPGRGNVSHARPGKQISACCGIPA